MRRFLAACSEDAKGESTHIELDWGGEVFQTSGLVVLEKNYLDVYPYEKWDSSKLLPQFIQDETILVAKATILVGKTSAPKCLTESELIALMDVNGIGTDATMAEHINTVIARNYVFKERGLHMVPSNLGVGLVNGLDRVGFEPSLSKPLLRRDMERKLRAICDGTKARTAVVAESIETYREVFIRATQHVQLIKDSCRRYLQEL